MVRIILKKEVRMGGTVVRIGEHNRAGMHFTGETIFQDGDLSADQIIALKRDPVLIVQENYISPKEAAANRAELEALKAAQTAPAAPATETPEPEPIVNQEPEPEPQAPKEAESPATPGPEPEAEPEMAYLDEMTAAELRDLCKDEGIKYESKAKAIKALVKKDYIKTRPK